MKQPPVELLVMARKRKTVSGLCTALCRHGIAIDVAGDADEAQRLFLDCGGHRLLVLGPDIGQGLARQVVACLRNVDPQLPVVAFGPETFRQDPPARLTRLPDFHPSSRAGIGAVLKAIQGLSLPSY